VVAVAFAIAVALILLSLLIIGFPSLENPKHITVSVFLDIVKLALSVAAGVGGIVALVMVYRRQRVAEEANRLNRRTQIHQELTDNANHEHLTRVATENFHDATERRITDLYGRSVEQLGHEKALVRLGGIYSLERLAQDHERYRQTVIDVLCAYLRMPYKLPPDIALEKIGEPPHDSMDEAHRELEVRKATQDVICRHLALQDKDQPRRPPLNEDKDFPDTYWPDMQVNLQGAVLVGFNYSNCRPHNTIFSGVHFVGYTLFWSTVFTDNAWFSHAHFDGLVRFIDTRFEGFADFGQTKFEVNADFVRVYFKGTNRFHGVSFRGSTHFRECAFAEAPDFSGSQISDDTNEHTWPAGWGVENRELKKVRR
jgi:hypothetical protein